MSALKQYIDLYGEHKDLIERNSAPVFNKLRAEGHRVLSERPELPKKGTENYETTDLDAMLAPDYGLNIARVPIDVNPAASFHCGVPSLSTSLFMMVNDLYAETDRSRDGLPLGVFAGSWKQFCEKEPEKAEKVYGKIADIKNPLVALNTMLAQDGIIIYVDKRVRVEKPIQIVNILQNTMPLMAVRRLTIWVEDEAEVKVLSCDHTQNPDQDFLSLLTVEIHAGFRGKIDYYDLEESTERTKRLASVYVEQEAESDVAIDGITLYNGETRNEYFCRFKGKDCNLHLYGMGIEDRQRHLDTYTKVIHKEKNCHTDELFKYVVDDEAVGAFAGLILVEPGADKTEAYQSNRNIVGSSEARMFSKPQLEIYCDDVKCSHGTATGQLDDKQVFYMRTRGLTEATAKLLLKQAFMADVIDKVRIPGLSDRLHMLVERRFTGGTSTCSGCQSGCSTPDEEIEGD